MKSHVQQMGIYKVDETIQKIQHQTEEMEL